MLRLSMSEKDGFPADLRLMTSDIATFPRKCSVAKNQHNKRESLFSVGRDQHPFAPPRTVERNRRWRLTI
ncbi:hypothetical protein ACLOJK_011881 [Asimina triloba]